MAGIAWAETLAAARARAAEERLLLLTYIYSPG